MNAETDEDMIPIFEYDVTGKELHNKHLLPRRNWCEIQLCSDGDRPTHELDVILNVEVDRRNSEGRTKGYRIKVPTLNL